MDLYYFTSAYIDSGCATLRYIFRIFDTEKKGYLAMKDFEVSPPRVRG